MKKTFVIFIMLTLVVTMVTGCGGSKKNEKIVIGVIQDLSGPTSVLGNAVKNGAELAVQKINEEGGIDGTQIELISYDVKLEPQEAINAYKRLVDTDKAVAIVGPPISNIGLAITPGTDQKKVPVVGSFVDPRCTTKEDGTPYDYMFLMQASSVQYAEILADYAYKEVGLRKMAVMYNQANAYGVSLVEPFKAHFIDLGGEIVEEQIYKKGDTDYKVQLGKIKSSEADGIYLPNYAQESVLTLQQMNQIGLDIQIIGGLDFAPPFADLLPDKALADGIFYANNYSDSEPRLTEVKEAYVIKFNEEPINKAYLGYDTILIIKDAIERAGLADAISITKALNSTKDLECTTGIITLSSETHRPLGLSNVMYKLEGGENIEVGRYVPDKHK